MPRFTLITKRNQRTIDTSRVDAGTPEAAAATLDARSLSIMSDDNDVSVSVYDQTGHRVLLAIPCVCRECGRHAVDASICQCQAVTC